MFFKETTMDAYKNLAVSYDRLTNDVDYSAVVDFYHTILQLQGIKPRTVADLACGTGSVSLLLAQQGYQVTGVDMSEDMLTVAADKTQALANRPVFARSCRNCGCPVALIWRSALWTV